MRKRTGYLPWLRRRGDAPFRDGGNIPAARRDADILHGQLNQLQRLLSLAMAEPTLSALPGPDPAH